MNQNELCHYGVVGMRWGHRKNGYYEGKSSSQVSKIGKSKTILGKNLHNYMAQQNDYKSNVRKAVNSDKGIIKKYDNLYGHGDLSARQKAASKYYGRKEGYSKIKYIFDYFDKGPSKILNKFDVGKDLNENIIASPLKYF